MPEMTSYEPGIPCWVHVQTPDMEATKTFYGGLFGWSSTTSPGPGGGYTMFTADGREVAAALPVMSLGRPAWISYVSVADADATMKAAERAGGRRVMAARDIPGQGRIAIFADPQGGALGLWQPSGFSGAAVVNEPNTYCWNELACRDIEDAKRFYGQVLGWASETFAFGPVTYTDFQAYDKDVAGMVEMDKGWPPDVPAHWMVYFAVADCDVTCARATELGGVVSVPPTDIPIGRFAVLNDPQGAHFSVIHLTQSDSNA